MKMRNALFLVAALAICSMAQAATTINYGDVTYSGGFASSNYSDVWNLMAGDLTLSYSVDLSGVAQTTAGETPYIEVGLRQVGSGNFNPGPFNTYQGGAGGWMTSLVTSTASNPGSLNLNDKHNLSASGGRGEGDYDVYASDRAAVVSPPFGNQDTFGFWYDRDGVDPYQNSTTANTGGKYNIEIKYHAIDSGLGSMVATINGVDQQFKIGGDYTGAAGLSFKGDMTQMQVFTGAWYTSGASGNVEVSNITATSSVSPVPEPGTIVAAFGLLGPAGFFFRRKKA